MNLKKCDRCGKQDMEHVDGILHVRCFILLRLFGLDPDKRSEYDLCPSCYQELKVWLMG